jgi:hypothetical protein
LLSLAWFRAGAPRPANGALVSGTDDIFRGSGSPELALGAALVAHPCCDTAVGTPRHRSIKTPPRRKSACTSPTPAHSSPFFPMFFLSLDIGVFSHAAGMPLCRTHVTKPILVMDPSRFTPKFDSRSMTERLGESTRELADSAVVAEPGVSRTRKQGVGIRGASKPTLSLTPGPR